MNIEAKMMLRSLLAPSIRRHPRTILGPIEALRVWWLPSRGKLPLPRRLRRSWKAEPRDHLPAASIQGGASDGREVASNNPTRAIPNQRIFLTSRSHHRRSNTPRTFFSSAVTTSAPRSTASMASMMSASGGTTSASGVASRTASTASRSQPSLTRRSCACTAASPQSSKTWDKSRG